MGNVMDETVRCCIDDEPLTPPYRTVGGRAYCERHYELVNKPHPGFWRASLFQIVLMGVISGVLAWLATLLGPLGGTALIVLGLVIAIVPSALWLIYFYRQDRLEPEPKTRILAVFLTALVLQDFLGRRLIDEWFDVARWASSDTITSLLASILIVGFTWQAIAYAAVRLMVYATPEFDERMDGIVYGTVAGLGVATLANLRYVLDTAGVALAPGVIQATTTALAQASFGGLMGYFMAQAKFEHRPVWWVPLGFTIAAVLNGLFSWLIGEISASGLTVDPWRSLALGLIVALLTFFALVWLMGRTTEVTLSRAAR
jgi:RsiW-degrading membrane proteinase PrsW (M82 family)